MYWLIRQEIIFKNQYVNIFWSCSSSLAYVGISLQLVWLLITSLGFDDTTLPPPLYVVALQGMNDVGYDTPDH